MTDRCNPAATEEGCVPAQPDLHSAPEEVRLGQVYTMVKAMQKKWTAPDDLIYADCQAILDFIAKR
jgi:hypothetical protein